MAEVYGDLIAQGLDDPPWIADASTKDQVILTKDFHSLRYGEPLKKINEVRARVFSMSNAQLLGPEYLRRLLVCQARIFRAASKPGPYIYKVYDGYIDPAWP